MIKESKKHLKSVKQTWKEHAICCLNSIIKLQKASFGLFFHGLIPALFPTTGSRIIKELNDKLKYKNWFGAIDDNGRAKVAVAIPLYEDKVLALKRANTLSYDGFWNFPGGTVDPGETYQQAAIRELFEETSLRAKESDLRLLGRVELDDKIIVFFGLKKWSGCLYTNFESSDEKWINIQDLKDYKFIPLNKNLIKEIQKYQMEK